MKLVPLDPAHWPAYKPGPVDTMALEGTDFPNLLRTKWAGKALTIMDGEAVLGFVGVGLDRDGTAQAWMLGSDALRDRPVTLHKGVLRVLVLLPEAFGITALECDVDAILRRNQRWVERLGFRFVKKTGSNLRYRYEWPS